MSNDLKKFEQSRKKNIANTMETWRGLRQLGIDELGRAVSGSKKPGSKKNMPKNQISRQLDKYENTIIKKRKNIQ